MNDVAATDRQILDYHYRDDTRFALRHVTDDADRHEAALADHDDEPTRTVQDTTDETTTYLIYTTQAPDGLLPDFETDAEVATWLREEFDSADLPVILAVYRIFRGILDESDDINDRLTLYKRLEFQRLPEVLNRVEWRQPVPDVAAELLSQFILAHPMPNANHRTAIGLVDRYLTSIDNSFVMPDTGEPGEWYEWAAAFIHDSKRLLTLQRDAPKFAYAAEFGYDAVRRKEGVTIDLTDHDLDRDDYREHYADRHRERALTFVDTLLAEAGAIHLQERTDDGKRAFVDRLRGG